MNLNLQLGDWVVLTGKGCHQSAPELMAIWTVEQLTPTHAIVSCDPTIQITELDKLERKRYPLDWLILYKRLS